MKALSFGTPSPSPNHRTAVTRNHQLLDPARPETKTTFCVQGVVAGVLHDLQVAALSGGFDTEEHAATDCDTALMPRPTEDSQALYGRLRQAWAGYMPGRGTAL